MIQAKDLRIGNWLLYDEDGKWTNQQVQYVAAGLQGYNGYYVSFGWATTTLQGDISNFDDWELYVKGIPLTPEILEKCGFEKKLLGGTVCYSKPFIRPMMVKKIPTHDILLIDFGNSDIEYAGKYAFAIREHDRDIQMGVSAVEYLHQLQNLTHALTQTELQIQL